MGKDGDSDQLEPGDNLDADKNVKRGGKEGGGMTLEDDVESMLSENHLNQSNSSMFRVRP